MFSPGADGNPFSAVNEHVALRDMTELEPSLPLDFVEAWLRACVEIGEEEEEEGEEGKEKGVKEPMGMISPRGPVPLYHM